MEFIHGRSPRSYSLIPMATARWVPKNGGARQDNTVFDSDFHPSLSAPPTHPTRPDLLSLSSPPNLLHNLLPAPPNERRSLSQLLPSQTQYPPATNDPFCSHTIRCPYSVPQTHILSAPNLILINSLISPQVQKCDSYILGVARERYPYPHAISPLCPNPSLPLALGDKYLTPTQTILLAFLKEYCNLLLGPLKPTSANPPLQHFNLTQAHLKNANYSPSTLNIPDHTGSPQDDFSLSPFIQQEDGFNSDHTRNGHIFIHTNLLGIDYQKNLSPVLTMDPTSSRPNPSDIPVRALTREAPLMPITNLSSSNYTALSTSSPAKQKEKRGKGKQLPTRRSERIQAKRQTDNKMIKSSAKSYNRFKGIQFELDSPDAPIDVNTTLAILQASGLEINKCIEEMIEQATRQASAPHNPDSDAPPTPLHDPIPPLIISGFDLPL